MREFIYMYINHHNIVTIGGEGKFEQAWKYHFNS